MCNLQSSFRHSVFYFIAAFCMCELNVPVGVKLLRYPALFRVWIAGVSQNGNHGMITTHNVAIFCNWVCENGSCSHLSTTGRKFILQFSSKTMDLSINLRACMVHMWIRVKGTQSKLIKFTFLSCIVFNYTFLIKWFSSEFCPHRRISDHTVCH